MENGDGEPAAKKSKGEVSESKKLKRDLEPSTENEMKKLKKCLDICHFNIRYQKISKQTIPFWFVKESIFF